MSKYEKCPKCKKKGYYTVYGYDPQPERGSMERCKYCHYTVRVREVKARVMARTCGAYACANGKIYMSKADREDIALAHGVGGWGDIPLYLRVILIDEFHDGWQEEDRHHSVV